MATDHDGIYKQLFSHPRMVADLLSHFAPVEWSKLLTGAGIERLNGSYASDDGAQRHSDMAWRLRQGAKRRYVLLEFQSTPDAGMALRMLVYTGLLYQELLKTKEIVAADRLPPALPVVLYNGTTPWRACNEVRDLRDEKSRSLKPFCLAQRHVVIDVRRLSQEQLAIPDSVVAAVFRAEVTDNPLAYIRAMSMLDEWSLEGDCSIGRAGKAWARHHGMRLDGWSLTSKFSREDRIMFNGELFKFINQAETEAREKGMQEGRQAGLQIGLKEGRQEGRQEGRLEGLRESVHLIARCRFGEVPTAIVEKIDRASAEEVARLAEMLLAPQFRE